MDACYVIRPYFCAYHWHRGLGVRLESWFHCEGETEDVLECRETGWNCNNRPTVNTSATACGPAVQRQVVGRLW